MFDIFSGQHILILLAVLLIVVGPKDLPRLMRMIGQWAGKARAMANEFKKSFDDMARQEELDKLRVELDELRRTNLNVAEDAQRVAEADLPAPGAGPAPTPGAAVNDAPRSGEYQINVTPPDAYPPGTAPAPSAGPAPAAGPASAAGPAPVAAEAPVTHS
jgi:sec-independent protein translocase protein TatB